MGNNKNFHIDFITTSTTMSDRKRKSKRDESESESESQVSNSHDESEEQESEELDSAELAMENELSLEEDESDDEEEAGASDNADADRTDDAADEAFVPKSKSARRRQARKMKKDAIDPRIQYLWPENEKGEKQQYPEDVQFYESESEDELDADANTVGNVPMEWYQDYDHIGYNIFGQKLLKSEEADRLDRFLSRSDDPAYWRTVRDELNAKDVVLSERELDLIRAMQRQRYPTTFDPYELPPEVDDPKWKVHPVSSRPEPKSRFVPSKWERLKIRRLVLAIRKGQFLEEKDDDEEQIPKYYNLWASSKRGRHAQFQQIKANKTPLPTHAESYRPPEEFLFDDEELKEWEELDEEERTISFVPQRYDRMRHVPLFADGLKERFERCLDLYLCPRTIKRKMNVDPKKLVPKMPNPKDLRPFPTYNAMTMKGHRKRVRSVSVHPGGQYVASGSDDGTVRVWELATGRCMRTMQFGAVVACVQWCPNGELSLLAVASGDDLYFVNARLGGPAAVAATDGLVGLYKTVTQSDSAVAVWRAAPADASRGEAVVISHPRLIKQISWHAKGDYCATVCPGAGPKTVLIHQLSGARTQAPFKKGKGRVEAISFHPTKPFFVLASQRVVRVYNLVRQKMFKKLQANVKWISSVDVHPGGDNIIVTSYDRRLCWFDLDLSTRPYKTLRYHSEAIRRAKFHSSFPLFASASDDGDVHVFHGMVYDDLASNALIVPLKVLSGHKVAKDGLGVLDLCWHPAQPWIVSAGADGTVRLWC